MPSWLKFVNVVSTLFSYVSCSPFPRLMWRNLTKRIFTSWLHATKWANYRYLGKNWSQFKDPVSNMCLAGAVIASKSPTLEVTGSNPLTVMANILVTEFSEFNENIKGNLNYVLIYVRFQLIVQNVVSAQPCVGKLGISLVLLNFLGCNCGWWFKTT